jgi:hypothetical protein
MGSSGSARNDKCDTLRWGSKGKLGTRGERQECGKEGYRFLLNGIGGFDGTEEDSA